MPTDRTDPGIVKAVVMAFAISTPGVLLLCYVVLPWLIRWLEGY